MKKLQIVSLLVALPAIVLAFGSFYVVNEWEQVIITQFGEPVGDPIIGAGIKFKLPLIQDVNRFDRRILEWDGERNQIPTAKGKFIQVDTTARWRIVDPLLFLQAARTEEGAQSKLDDILDGATRDEISSHILVELVRSTNRILDVLPSQVIDNPDEQPEVIDNPDEQPEVIDNPDEQSDLIDDLEKQIVARISLGRNMIADAILARARKKAPEYGIELISLSIKRLNYEESVRRDVYRRMISERQAIAGQLRAEGEKLKLGILGKKEEEVRTISSEGKLEAQEILAKAETRAAEIYTAAYGADPEFYAFWRTLQAYEKILAENHTLVVSPDSDLYRYLSEGGDAPEGVR